MDERTSVMLEKRLAVVRNVVETAKAISSLAKKLPRTGKKRNIFIKNYNRRPRNKSKQAVVLSQIGISTYLGSARNQMILSQPVRKFKSGGITHAN